MSAREGALEVTVERQLTRAGEAPHSARDDRARAGHGRGERHVMIGPVSGRRALFRADLRRAHAEAGECHAEVVRPGGAPHLSD